MDFEKMAAEAMTRVKNEASAAQSKAEREKADREAAFDAAAALLEAKVAPMFQQAADAFIKKGIPTSITRTEPSHRANGVTISFRCGPTNKPTPFGKGVFEIWGSEVVCSAEKGEITVHSTGSTSGSRREKIVGPVASAIEEGISRSLNSYLDEAGPS